MQPRIRAGRRLALATVSALAAGSMVLSSGYSAVAQTPTPTPSDTHTTEPPTPSPSDTQTTEPTVPVPPHTPPHAAPGSGSPPGSRGHPPHRASSGPAADRAARSRDASDSGHASSPG